MILWGCCFLNQRQIKVWSSILILLMMLQQIPGMSDSWLNPVMMMFWGLCTLQPIKNKFRFLILIMVLSIGQSSATDKITSPLQLTQEAQITNFTITSNFSVQQVNTDEKGPVLVIHGKEKTEAFYPYTTILDLKSMALLLHNLKVNTKDHQMKLQYEEQKKFIRSTYGVHNKDPDSTFEYFEYYCSETGVLLGK